MLALPPSFKIGTMKAVAARACNRAWALGGVVAVAACSSHEAPRPPAAAPVASVAAAAPAGPIAPALMTSADVDRGLQAEWRRAGVGPTAPAPDATWLRRSWIDVVGTVPPPESVRHFLADGAADKRARAIDELLASPLYADHWTDYWGDVWMGRNPRGPDVDPAAFRQWLHAAFARNAPWSDVVTELLTATGRNSEGESRREAKLATAADEPPAEVHGAVNWTLRYRDDPQDMAGAASRTLLGVQIQCAQCHDHKTEKWTQKDFQSFAASFLRTRLVPIDKGKAGGAVKRVDVYDLDHVAPRFTGGMKAMDVHDLADARPTALDGTDLGAAESVRTALAKWVTAPQNPWFARAFVNRMWGHFLGRGFVDPVDDLRPSNPPVAPDLLDALAADFVASGYDVKHLIRVIAGTRAYATSAAPLDEATARADPEAKLWERFRVTPLGPGELLDALAAATHLRAAVDQAGVDLDAIRARVRQRYGFLFDVDEETDPPDYEGTIAQALVLLNGSVVAAGVSALPGGAVDEVLEAPGDDGVKIDALYLRALSRFATGEEQGRWMRYLLDAEAPAARPTIGAPPAPVLAPQPDPLRGVALRASRRHDDARTRAFEDLLWTLLNSSEFVFNH